jgi:hypothetical protein
MNVLVKFPVEMLTGLFISNVIEEEGMMAGGFVASLKDPFYAFNSACPLTTALFPLSQHATAITN